MQQSLIKHNNNQKGYILVELAIVVVVLGILMATLFPFYQSYTQRNAIAETKKRMAIISKAFSTHTQRHFRLPCPADSTVPIGNQLGVERAVCDVNVRDAHGIVPYRTLGLPEQYAKDGYGNFFTYVVSPNFTVDNRIGIQADSVNIRLAHLVAGDAVTGNFSLLPRSHFCAPLINNGTDIVVNQDGATLYATLPRNTTNVARATNPDPNLNREGVVTAVAMALISHGENGRGAYQSDGNQSPFVPPILGTGTAEEITSINTNRIVETESEWVSTGAAEYDDIVTFYTQDEIYAAAGRNSCEHL